MRTNLRPGPGVLVVTIAAAACLASTCPAAANGAVRAVQPGDPPASAGWHGRAILQPERRDVHARLTAAAMDAAPKASVRAVQAMLRRLGYRPGPVDGLFGPRTSAALQWFQIKHALPPTGLADPQTTRRLGLGATGRRIVVPAGPLPTLRTEPPRLKHALRLPLTARPARPAKATRHRGWSDAPVVALVAALALAALAAAGLVLRGRPGTANGADRRSAAGRRPSAEPPASEPARADALGYASGRDAAELDGDVAAISRACAERGWTLGRLVRDGGTAPGRRGHPAFAYALRHVARERVPRLVIGRLDHAGSTPAELAPVLRWCARHRVELVALDVGLDTGTPDGKAAARSLLAIGDRQRAGARSARVAPRPRQREERVET